MVMKIIRTAILLVFILPETTTSCSLPCTRIHLSIVLLLIGSIRCRSSHHRIISWSILTVEHLCGVLVNGLCTPHIQVLFVFKHSPLLLDDLLVCWVAFFETLGVPQRIQRVIARCTARADTREHDDFDFIASQEGIPQNHS